MTEAHFTSSKGPRGIPKFKDLYWRSFTSGFTANVGDGYPSSIGKNPLNGYIMGFMVGILQSTTLVTRLPREFLSKHIFLA